jgi:streptogramin lyase
MAVARGYSALLVASVGLAGCGGSDGGGSGGGGLDLGQMWVADDESSLVKVVDTATGEAETIEVGAHTEHVAIGAGAVWFTTDQGTLLRIDPVSRELVATVSGFDAIRDVAVDANGVWVADNGDGSVVPPQLRHVDPSTNSIVSSFPVQGDNDQYHELVSGSAGLYLQIDNGFAVSRIDPESDSVLETLPLGKEGGYGSGELALDGDSLWTADQYSNFLHQLSAAPLSAVAEYPIDARLSGDLAVSGDWVFLEDTDGQSIAVFDAKDGSLSHEIDAGAPVTVLAVRDGTLVVALSDQGYGSVLVFDPATGKQLKELEIVYADDVAFE